MTTRSALLPVYAQFPLRAVSGRGSWIVDEHGERWLDAYGGHAVASTGHSHPHVVQAIAAQAAQLLFYSTVLPHPLREQMAERLVAQMPEGVSHAFFCNSGAEANECAIKIARLYGHQRGIENPSIVVMEKAWHGRTLATLSATGSRKAQA
ncbi:MAG TPA: aminotransferase class III-fold pyridoxal phosphate-dependent enzyme, partial [Gemmatimonadales bacterium]|nr:aminotransferase class III-fold pyridoxal phosphate-dependent enzyme [Gemmatimonadales bacterium]